MAVLAIGSVAVILAFDSQRLSSGQLMFFVPALLSTSIGLWLTVSEGGPRAKVTRPT